MVSAPAKAVGNIPGSAWNFAKGIVSFFNPVNIYKNVKSDVQGFSQAASDFGGGASGAGKAAVELGKNLPEAAYKTLVPDFFRNVISFATESDPKKKETARQSALDSVVDDPVGQIAPVLLAARAMAEQAGVAPQFDEAMQKVSSPVETAVSKTAEGAGKLVGGSVKFLASQATGLNPETMKVVSQNPDAFTPEKIAGMTRATLGDEVSKALDEKSGSLAETGKEYGAIRSSDTPVKVEPGYLAKLISDKTGIDVGEDGKLTTSGAAQIRDPADVRALQNLYNVWKPVFDSGKMTANEFLNFRKDLADMAKFDRQVGKSQPLENLAGIMRGDFNATYRGNVPGLQDLDTRFAPQIEEFGRLKKGILDRDGNLSETAINRIANATGKGKDAQLGRLEDISPGITQRIKILKAIEDIQATAGQKVGTYTRTALGSGGLVGGIATGNIPLIAGALGEMLISQPDVAVKMIKAAGSTAPLAKAVLQQIKGGAQAINQLPDKAMAGLAGLKNDSGE